MIITMPENTEFENGYDDKKIVGRRVAASTSTTHYAFHYARNGNCLCVMSKMSEVSLAGRSVFKFK